MDDPKKTQLKDREVILSSGTCKGNEAERTVTVGGGFGATPGLRGRALMVEFPDGEKSRWDRDDIDWEATSKLWKLEAVVKDYYDNADNETDWEPTIVAQHIAEESDEEYTKEEWDTLEIIAERVYSERKAEAMAPALNAGI